MLGFFSKKKKDVLEQEIIELKELLSLKDKEIASLKEQLQVLNENKESDNNSTPAFNPKQIDIFEKNLKDSKEENRRLKTELELLKQEKQEIKVDFSNNYKFNIEDFFSSSRFNEIKNNLSEMDIKYIQDIDIQIFEDNLGSIKNSKDAKKKFEDYLDGIVEWDVKVALEKGERVTKIFSKYRKFLNIITENYIEFMDDLKGFNWEILDEKGFSQEQIHELKNKVDEYYSNRKL